MKQLFFKHWKQAVQDAMLRRKNKYFCDFPDFMTGGKTSGVAQGRGSQEEQKVHSNLTELKSQVKVQKGRV